jgi:hypothetical protein
MTQVALHNKQNSFTRKLDLHIKWEIVKCYIRRTALSGVETRTYILQVLNVVLEKDEDQLERSCEK